MTTEHQFLKSSDGQYFSSTGGRGYDFWQRYLESFEEVCVIARVRSRFGEDGVDALEKADGNRVSFVELPSYTGPFQYLRRAFELRRQIKINYDDSSAFILRVPGMVGNVVESLLHKKKHPYGVEVVGDPYDLFSSHAVVHPLRRIFRWYFVRRLRAQCAQASTAAYVTSETLQRRYPAGPKTFSINYSSVELPCSAFVKTPRAFQQMSRPVRLIFVGSFARMYKAPDTLLEAVSLLLNKDCQLALAMLGDGKFRSEMEYRANRLGIEKVVQFTGYIPANERVRRYLDDSDLFVMPSRTEGLPRAMIEAMARGLPCIGTDVGGIPELLPPEALVPPNNAPALAQKIESAIRDVEWLRRMSARNLETARDYQSEKLQARRRAHYIKLAEVTKKWLETRSK